MMFLWRRLQERWRHIIILEAVILGISTIVLTALKGF